MYFFYNKMALPAETSQAVLLYTVSGAHLVMLLAAMTYLAVISFRALGGQFTSRQHDGISAAALYWHTMVALYALIWISIFVTK
jgi:cytochrome c oxidase subunit 3